jgi:hypothetical protein
MHRKRTGRPARPPVRSRLLPAVRTPSRIRVSPIRKRMVTQEATLPLRLISEANAREHWSRRKRRRAAQRGQVRLVAQATMSRPRLPCVVTLTRVAPRSLDSDNLVSSFKASRDGICDWIGVDDRTDQITWEYTQKRGGVREYALKIRIDT